MSQQSVERALGRMVTDGRFRDEFFRDPAGASLRAGLDLTSSEMDALVSVPMKALCALERCLDDRICRLTIPSR